MKRIKWNQKKLDKIFWISTKDSTKVSQLNGFMATRSSMSDQLVQQLVICSSAMMIIKCCQHATNNAACAEAS